MFGSFDCRKFSNWTCSETKSVVRFQKDIARHEIPSNAPSLLDRYCTDSTYTGKLEWRLSPLSRCSLYGSSISSCSRNMTVLSSKVFVLWSLCPKKPKRLSSFNPRFYIRIEFVRLHISVLSTLPGSAWPSFSGRFVNDNCSESALLPSFCDFVFMKTSEGE